VPKILNECILWTVEGIRLSTRYPSLEPCLTDTLRFSENSGYFRLGGRELIQVAELYLDWYEEYRVNPTEPVLTRNIFIDTPYRW
jgi:hypothetical protein